MSKWTHRICPECWNAQHPDKPTSLGRGAGTDRCCYCGEDTAGGIFVRADPWMVRCQGQGGPHGDE